MEGGPKRIRQVASSHRVRRQFQETRSETVWAMGQNKEGEKGITRDDERREEGLDKIQDLGFCDRKMVVALTRNWLYRKTNKFGIENNYLHFGHGAFP